MRDQAAACERRSHSSKPTRPRRASPNGTSESCSTPAAPVSGFGVAHDLARIADRLQIAGDDFVERRSLRTGDLNDAIVRWRERHIGNAGSNVVRTDGLEQDGREPDQVSIRT
jgi:hypothetical protein